MKLRLVLFVTHILFRRAAEGFFFFFQIKVFKRMNELRQQLSKMQKREKMQKLLLLICIFSVKLHCKCSRS